MLAGSTPHLHAGSATTVSHRWMDPAASAAGSDLADVAPAADEESGCRSIRGGAGDGEREGGARRERASARRVRKTDQSLRLFSIKLAHGWQDEICATVTAGRGPVGDWSAQIGRGRDKRQLVTRVSCTCDGGRLFWATLAGIPARGVHVGSTGPSVSRFRPPVCFESCRCPETCVPPGNWRTVGFSLAPPGSTCRFGLSDRVPGER